MADLIDNGLLKWLLEQIPVVVVCIAWVWSAQREKQQAHRDLRKSEEARAEMARETTAAMSSSTAALQALERTIISLSSRGQ